MAIRLESVVDGGPWCQFGSGLRMLIGGVALLTLWK